MRALSDSKKHFRRIHMAKPEFVYVTYIATTPEKLWAALTRGEFTKKYWYSRRIESDWTVGSAVRFFDGDSDVLTDSGVVLECDPRDASSTPSGPSTMNCGVMDSHMRRLHGIKG